METFVYVCFLIKDGGQMGFEIEVSDEAEEFLENLEQDVKEKFVKVFFKVKEGNNKGDDFKKLSGSEGIFEFRVNGKNKYYRLLAFMSRYEGDDFTTIICTHGFEKKTNKTPKKEIKKAEKIKKEYL